MPADLRDCVVHLTRRPHPGQVSIEIVFTSVREGLAARGRYPTRVVVSGHPNTGVLPRLRAVLEARRIGRHAALTHVVGDVHFLVLLLRRSRTVLTVHDVEFLARHGGAKAALYRWLWVVLPARRSALVTCVSEATRDDLLAMGVDATRLRVVHNPVREVFVPAPLPSGPRPRVLLMGTWPNKNLERSAQALTGLDVDVTVVGPLSDSQRALLAPLSPQCLADLDSDQVRDALHACDLLLFPSLKEGFGVPIIEAQACGRPVVTSDRRPMSDVAGDGACLVDPQDVASIRAGVQRVVSDPAYAARLVEAGLQNAARYRPQAVAAAYEAVYDEVLGGCPAATDRAANQWAAQTSRRQRLLTDLRRRLAATDRHAQRALGRRHPYRAPDPVRPDDGGIAPDAAAADCDTRAWAAFREPSPASPALRVYRTGRAGLGVLTQQARRTRQRRRRRGG